MMRIAVTGANGFIGRHVVRHAVASGYEVSGVVRSQAAAQVVREAGGHPVELVGRDPEALVRALDGCRAVVHLAQIGAERGGQTYEAVNVGMTERVLEDARHAGVPRVVYFSGLGVARYGMSPRSLERLLPLEARGGDHPLPLRPRGRRLPPVLRRGARATPSCRRCCRPWRGVTIERPGDGSYRVQPIAVADAASCVLAAVERPAGAFPSVFDLVGPEALPYARLLERLARVARALGRPAELRVREIPVEEADRRARAGGYQGMLPDELDCLLCDEVSDPAPLESLLGRPLTPLDEALAAAVRAA